MRNFGYLKDDKYIHNLSYCGSSVVDIKEVVELGDFKVKDQKNTNACVGFALSTALEMLFSLNFNQIKYFSGLFLYANSRLKHENLDNKRRIIERDEGTYPHITINQLKKYGVCDEKKWDDVNKVNYIPPLETYFNARNYAKTINFYSVYDVIPGIEKALSDSSDSKKVVVVGCRVDQGFTENNGEIIKVNNNSVIGGHMMVINGYNRSNATVDLHNSWSTNWGNNGKGKVEYEWLIKNTTDCYVIEIS